MNTQGDVSVAVGLPARRGPRPATTTALPHQQLDQQPDDPVIRMELARRLFALPGVDEAPSGVSVQGARAAVLTDALPTGPRSAFFAGREFAHLHPVPDLSLHLTLPESLARQAIAAGWAEHHYLVATGELPPTVVMVYAPRDRDELEVVWRLVAASYRFATTPAAAPAARATPESEVPPMKVTGFRHVGLTVTDLDRSAAWYADLFGFEELFREANDTRATVIMRMPGTALIVGLVRFPATGEGVFDPTCVGLDHLCFAVADRDALAAWAAGLDARGIPHSGVVEMATGPILNFKDPDGIALSLALPPVLA